MTTPKAKFASLALIAALCAGFTLGLTACTDEAAFNAGVAAYKRGNYATAIRELRPLAEQGHAKAQYNLGQMYRKGQGVPQDYAEAVKWYRKAAKQGVAEAQYILGSMYKDGLGAPQDYAEAVKWYRKAAEQGYAKAQNNLGFTYSKGRGIPQDYAQAYMWFKLASSTFPPGEKRDIAVRNGDFVGMRMTPAQLFEAQKLAREWRPK